MRGRAPLPTCNKKAPPSSFFSDLGRGRQETRGENAIFYLSLSLRRLSFSSHYLMTSFWSSTSFHHRMGQPSLHLTGGKFSPQWLARKRRRHHRRLLSPEVFPSGPMGHKEGRDEATDEKAPFYSLLYVCKKRRKKRDFLTDLQLSQLTVLGKVNMVHKVAWTGQWTNTVGQGDQSFKRYLSFIISFTFRKPMRTKVL